MGYFANGYETHPELRRRIELTVSCADSKTLPRVADAGEVVSDGDDYVQIMHNGVKVKAGGYYGTWMAEIIERLKGVHEPQEELAFHLVVQRLASQTKDPTIVEVGAFWSYYSLWALHEMPNGRAILVEPDPNNLAVGERNFALNGRNGTFIQAAVGGQPSEPQPFMCESDGVTRDIPTVSLQSIVQQQGLERIDLLLVDVQGAELDFLSGGAAFLANHVRFALVSTHHHTISGDPLTHQQTLELLTSLGAHIIAEHTIGESVSGDGLIAVSFDERDRDLIAPISYGREGHTLYRHPMVDLAEQAAAHALSVAEFQSTLKARDHEIQLLQDQLKIAESQLRLSQDSIRDLQQESSNAQQQLHAVTSTRTWHLHERLTRSPLLKRATKALGLARRAQ
jgi:FkbM family methyltransferase